jgi:excisionase family DNA binding protein
MEENIRLLTIPEASGVTRMSKSWFRGKIQRQEIEHIKIGRRVFIPEEVIDQLLERGRITPVE